MGKQFSHPLCCVRFHKVTQTITLMKLSEGSVRKIFTHSIHNHHHLGTVRYLSLFWLVFSHPTTTAGFQLAPIKPSNQKFLFHKVILNQLYSSSLPLVLRLWGVITFILKVPNLLLACLI